MSQQLPHHIHKGKEGRTWEMKGKGFGKSEIYLLTGTSADQFIIRRTKQFYVFLIFGHQCKISIEKALKGNNLYFHVTRDAEGDIHRIQIDTRKRFEFQGIKLQLLQDVYKKLKLKTPKEERNMFANHKITKVEFAEINDVALEAAVEKVAANLSGVEIRTKGDETYLVKDGTVIQLNGEDFLNLVKDYVVGKTISELTRNNEMYTLIKTLGIIKSATVEKDASSLSSIFG